MAGPGSGTVCRAPWAGPVHALRDDGQPVNPAWPFICVLDEVSVHTSVFTITLPCSPSIDHHCYALCLTCDALDFRLFSGSGRLCIFTLPTTPRAWVEAERGEGVTRCTVAAFIVVWLPPVFELSDEQAIHPPMPTAAMINTSRSSSMQGADTCTWYTMDGSH
eukprot:scpid43138/ scgid16800/ 